ncbi:MULTISPECIES: GntR family transcriptional regulator [Pacificibacter]|uniref:GntR family transcriptional regulator n=1 Tax=Pacificibacter TaxID=1042323 RepID=UPI001C09120A|nr:MULTISPECIES: GntR family transcriptional regulator [Pacificibacter]MBU2936431.1 GntR family transcriptional regulator [Pacificibacter marinus]MDO6616528.1 GntR family transcriptional regulator [Pacificibacter sp. 1_MG-2023]
MKPSGGNPNVLPAYVQISELLIRDISAGRLMDGERLPPEREMAKSLKTSVGTLRKALDILVEKNLLERIQGSGNYIRHGGDSNSIYAMFRLELLGGGGLPIAQILSIDAMEKPHSLPPFGTSTHATRIRRLRFLNETIIAVEEIWLDADAGQVPEGAISDSLYHFYKEQLGFWITRAEDRVGIGAVPEWAPENFTKPSGTLTGYIERLSWADAPEAVEFSRTWFDTDQALYVQRLK